MKICTFFFSFMIFLICSLDSVNASLKVQEDTTLSQDNDLSDEKAEETEKIVEDYGYESDAPTLQVDESDSEDEGEDEDEQSEEYKKEWDKKGMSPARNHFHHLVSAKKVVSRYKKNKFKLTRALFNTTERRAKEKFIGRNKEIDNILGALRKMTFEPDDIDHPIVLYLIGPPGTGKTELLRFIVAELGLNSLFTQINIEEKQRALPVAHLLQSGEIEGKETKKIQRIILYDEIQNLRNHADVFPKGQREKWEKYREKIALRMANKGQSKKFNDLDEEIEKMNPAIKERIYSNQVLRSVLGNGVLVKNIDITPHGYYKKLLGLQASLQEGRKEVAKINQEIELLKNESREEKRELRLRLGHAKTYLKDLKETIKKNINEMSDNYPRLFKKDYKNYDVELLTNKFISSSSEFIQHVKDNLSKLRPQKTTFFKRLLIIFAGNPENITKKVEDRLNFGKDEGENAKIDPDAYRQAITDELGEMEPIKWLEKILGADSGLRSRLDTSRVTIIPPFSSGEWRKLIANKLENRKMRLEEKFKDHNIPATIKFHERVEKLIYEEIANPTLGGRSLLDIDSKLLGTFMINFPREMRREEHESFCTSPGIKEIIVDFDSKKNLLLAYHLINGNFNNKEILATYSIGFQQRSVNTKDKSILQRLAIHQAGHALVGTVMFGAVPHKLELQDLYHEKYLTKLWDNYKVRTLHNKYNIFMTLMGGYAVERELLSDTFQSERAYAFEIEVKKVAKEIQDELETRRIRQSRDGHPRPLEKLINKELAENFFFKTINPESKTKINMDDFDEKDPQSKRELEKIRKANKEIERTNNEKIDLAIIMSFEMVRALFYDQKYLIAAWANELLNEEHKGVLDGKILRKLFRDRFKTRPMEDKHSDMNYSELGELFANLLGPNMEEKNYLEQLLDKIQIFDLAFWSGERFDTLRDVYRKVEASPPGKNIFEPCHILLVNRLGPQFAPFELYNPYSWLSVPARMNQGLFNFWRQVWRAYIEGPFWEVFYARHKEDSYFNLNLLVVNSGVTISLITYFIWTRHRGH